MKPDVRQSLEQLQTRLAETRSADAQRQAQIDELHQHVAAAVAQEGSAHHDTLKDRLDKSLILFGDDHPDVAAALRMVIDSLGRMGV